jgi:ATP-dependent exoDNAse (exonuclease V) alpha subunit
MMVDEWFTAQRAGQSLALVTATHAEAQAVGEAIQKRRVELGDLDTKRSVSGQIGQLLFEGDVVQTRRNNSAAGVDNRDSWTIREIKRDGILLNSTSDSAVFRKISREYADAHLHLGYATTVQGIQGETTDRSLVGPRVDAAGLYVGLTRGRTFNEIIVEAGTPERAVRELAEMMQRGMTEETLEISRDAANREFRIAARGPARTRQAETTGPVATGAFGPYHGPSL